MQSKKRYFCSAYLSLTLIKKMTSTRAFLPVLAGCLRAEAACLKIYRTFIGNSLNYKPFIKNVRKIRTLSLLSAQRPHKSGRNTVFMPIAGRNVMAAQLVVLFALFQLHDSVYVGMTRLFQGFAHNIWI